MPKPNCQKQMNIMRLCSTFKRTPYIGGFLSCVPNGAVVETALVSYIVCINILNSLTSARRMNQSGIRNLGSTMQALE